MPSGVEVQVLSSAQMKKKRINDVLIRFLFVIFSCG
jgi:hypothetical protein